MASTYTRAVCMACEEKGIDYRLTETPLGAPEIKALHPFGKMPVLRHAGVVVFESKAIATYLDGAFPGPRLFPEQPAALAVAEQWISLTNTVIDPTLIRTYLMVYIRAMMTNTPPDRAAIGAVAPAVREQIRVLDDAVAATGYLAGDQFTFADINLLPILHRLQAPPEAAEALAAAANLSRYYAVHSQRPSFIRTMPPDRPPDRARPTPTGDP